ncbi:hypothetical protein Back2_08090 [Nocardioides baekrokdamisoli]|uniref:Peptidoglycan recognition protein family domain-containing protein n=1 Tax=Nocardioides baekrokdamisoli TaxID=1804624 RepID=A0A3G9IDT2_9ACTN|nr:FG-GAP-like repeat-containing protein [Nocardioides baekrokdamisoli]BBH16522.1 hypothetical protein Back2_08090 [Nocardioides baekrokdamisoli]
MVSKTTRSRAYFMAFSQQLLVLGAVGAALIPASAVINLDVVAQTPAHTAIGAPAPAPSATTSQTPQSSVVPVGTVKVTGHDVALTAATTAAPVKKDDSQASIRTVVSNITPVTGYGIVGLTWAHGENLAKDDVTADVRTETNGVWSGWTPLDYDDDGYAPDPKSPDGLRSRPGFGEALVGKVDFVQARLTVAKGALPTDLKLAVIDTGMATKTAVEAPAIDTARLGPNSKTPDTMLPSSPKSASEGAIAPMADTYALSAAVTAKPVIYSRAQWGADESWRDPTSLHYFEIHGGFVHHTVNSNDYTAADVPAIIRGIYYFHTHSRGWSDIGYNFLIDKFGRIWEGRYGGVDRAVVGAHAYGVNDYAFGVSAIGNYNEVRPSQALLNAEGALFAWKLSLSGVSASADRANIAGVVFNSPIQGHRDAVRVNSLNQTECPGTYLYAAIPTIRRIAAADQAGWAERNLHTSLVGPYPSIVARRASDSQIVVLPTGGISDFAAQVKVAGLPAGQTSAVPTPDVTGDGKGDLISYGPTSFSVYAGNGAGGFALTATRATTAFANLTHVTAVGDVTGDGKNDLVGINAAGHAVLLNGNGGGAFGVHVLPLVVGHPTFFLGAGVLTSDHKPDLLAISSTGVMTRFHGNGAGAFASGVTVPGSYPGGSSWSGIGDFTGDGRADIVERSASGTGYVWPGNGAGGFSHWVGPYGATASLGNIAGAAVLSGHRYPDLVGVHDGAIWMAANSGRTDLNNPIATGIFLPNANLLLNVGDWDGNGIGDFMARLSNGQLYLYRGKGNGQFYPAQLMTPGAGSWTNIAAPGDVTGDGHPDLQVQSGNSLLIVVGRGATLGFAGAYVSHAALAGTQIAAGLWDGDGAPDSIFRSGSSLTVWLGDGPGGLYASKALNLNVSAYNWIAGEAPGRGGTHPDLFARETASGALVQRTGTNLNQYRYMGSGLNAYNLLG